MVVFLAPSVAMTGINMRTVCDKHLATVSRRHRSVANSGVGQRMAVPFRIETCLQHAMDLQGMCIVHAKNQDFN